MQQENCDFSALIKDLSDKQTPKCMLCFMFCFCLPRGMGSGEDPTCRCGHLHLGCMAAFCAASCAAVLKANSNINPR